MSTEREINCYSGDLGIEKGMSYRELRDVILNRLLEYDKHINRPRDVERAVINSVESLYCSAGLNAAIITMSLALYGVDLKDARCARCYRSDKSFRKLEAGEYDDQLTQEDKQLIEEDMEEIRQRAGWLKVRPKSYRKGSYNYLGIRNGYSYRDHVDGIIDGLNENLVLLKSNPRKEVAIYKSEGDNTIEENGLDLAFSEIAFMLFEMEAEEVEKYIATAACTALSELESGEYDFLLTQEDIEELNKDGEKIKRYCKDHNILNPEEFGLKLN